MTKPPLLSQTAPSPAAPGGGVAAPVLEGDGVTLFCGDAREVMRRMAEAKRAGAEQAALL